MPEDATRPMSRENLTLIYLRRIDAKVDSLAADLRDVRERMTAVEIGLAGIRLDIGGLAETPG